MKNYSKGIKIIDDVITEVKINENGKILKRVDLQNIVNLKECGNFTLSTRGDFTGFEVKRKFCDATLNNPQFSFKINLRCGESHITIQKYTYISL